MPDAPSVPVQAAVPAGLFAQAQDLVDAGWYGSVDEVVLDALRRFLESHRVELIETFIRQDLDWGLSGVE